NPETPKLFAKRYSLNADSRGFTLLLSALISSVVLALGVSIFQIALKQVTLSSMGRESQFAFYAADTGAECALYWDVRNDIHPNTFATSTFSNPASGVSCDEPTYITPAAITTSFPPDGSAVSTFQFEPSGRCAQVSVTKCETDGLCDPLNPYIHTVIHADGFNTTCALIGSSARSLQRSVELHY
ncbi:MAG: pilus assembly PilX N-terminal domain-containing protein, partial [bacterium]|nr:pilus assembly PilX N-terminal domain-containing protein [bacterium]